MNGTRRRWRAGAAALLCLFVAISAPGARAQEKHPDDVLATVDGQPITRAELDRRLIRHFGKIVRDRFIVFEKLVEHGMAAQGLTIAEEAVDARLRELSDELLRDEGQTLEQALAQRPGDPALLRHLVRLEIALLRMARDYDKIPPDEPLTLLQTGRWFRSARLDVKSVQRNAKYLDEGVIVRVGDVNVPESHAVDLLYLAFTRDHLTDMLHEMAEERLIDRWVAEAGVKIDDAAGHGATTAARDDELIIERLSLDEIFKLARASEDAARDRARVQRQLEQLVRATISEDEIRAEFDAHRDWYRDRPVRISQVFIGRIDPDTGRLRSPAERAEAVRVLNEIKKEVADRGDFATLAFHYSEDASAVRGGDLGEFPRLGLLGDALNAAAMELKKGEVAGPIESDIGFHLIKATGIGGRGSSKLSHRPTRERVIRNLILHKLPSWRAERLRQATIRLH